MKTTIIVLKFIVNFLYLLFYATTLSMSVLAISMTIISFILTGTINETIKSLILVDIVGSMWVIYILLEYIQTEKYERRLRLPFPEVGL